MHQHPSALPATRPQAIAEKAISTVERFLHIEAVSGIVLLIAAAVAIIWANSPYAASYEHLWHAPVTLGFDEYVFTQSLHFWINDGLMTIFFLVVGMEIRREIHDGALSSLRLAALPIGAAIGGVIVPAGIFLLLNDLSAARQGWAVPTATDIAFAVGVLALLGRSIPSGVRVFLLALAIIDDIVAVLIIAFFYTSDLDLSGLVIAAAGVLLTLGMRAIGIGVALLYAIPAGILWIGLLKTGVHPTLAGVVLGLMTPVVSKRLGRHPAVIARWALTKLTRAASNHSHGHGTDGSLLKDLRTAQRELVPPVTRIEMALHPWVAYGIMPLFALANAGVSLNGIDTSYPGSSGIIFGVAVALVLGKPLGVMAFSGLLVRLGWCQLPPGVSWNGVTLVGLLAGIGFTMSIFISTLAFADPFLLNAAKAGVLAGSLIAAVLGVSWGMVYARRQRAKAAAVPLAADRAA